MEIVSLTIGCAMGLALGTAIAYWFSSKKSALLQSQLDKRIYQQEQAQKDLAEAKHENDTLRLDQLSLTEQKGTLESLNTTCAQQLEVMRKEQHSLSEKAEQLQREANEQRQVADTRYNELTQENSRLKAQHEADQERNTKLREEIKQLHDTTKLQFEKLASDILEQKAQRFTESNRDNIAAILSPLSESIKGFKEKVEHNFHEETKQRTSLEQQVINLISQTNKVSTEANQLASALKGQSKTMGNWGEMILESILQHSGLEKGREYQAQNAYRDPETGKLMIPDVLVNLPDDRTIIIDSKVSLVAYNRYFASTTPDEQAVAIKEHIQSVRSHIANLQSKRYDNLPNALDFTMLFIPIEPAYILAVQHEPGLWEEAYKQRIMLVSPTNLIACLKLISDLWRREQQSKNAMEIVNRGERMYDKFASLAKTMEELGNTIDKTRAKYDEARGQFCEGRGNLIAQAEHLHKLGLKSSKTLPSAMLDGSSEEE